jgi:hypothetical protein
VGCSFFDIKVFNVELYHFHNPNEGGSSRIENLTLRDFLDLIQPEYAMISCGKDNRYGHPHEELLERLDDIGSAVVLLYSLYVFYLACLEEHVWS